MCLFYCTAECGSYNLSCATNAKSTKKRSSQLTLGDNDEKGIALSEKMSAHEKRRAALIRHFHLSFYKGTIAITALGTYYTFLLVAQPDPLSEATANAQIFTPKSSRTLIAVAWLLFLLSLGLSTAALLSYSFGYATARLSLQNTVADNVSVIAPSYYATKKKGPFGWEEELAMAVTSGVIFFIILTAFLISSLAVIAYMPAIGVVGAVFIGIFFLTSLAVWIRQLV
jgi:hypothetical protein